MNAPWLDSYLQELTTFPNAKFDDQVDSTSQALAWIKVEGREPGILAYYRKLVQEFKHPQTESSIVLLAPPNVTHVETILKRRLLVGADRRVSLTEREARPLRLCGWTEAL